MMAWNCCCCRHSSHCFGHSAHGNALLTVEEWNRINLYSCGIHSVQFQPWQVWHEELSPKVTGMVFLEVIPFTIHLCFTATPQHALVMMFSPENSLQYKNNRQKVWIHQQMIWELLSKRFGTTSTKYLPNCAYAPRRAGAIPKETQKLDSDFSFCSLHNLFCESDIWDIDHRGSSNWWRLWLWYSSIFCHCLSFICSTFFCLYQYKKFQNFSRDAHYSIHFQAYTAFVKLGCWSVSQLYVQFITGPSRYEHPSAITPMDKLRVCQLCFTCDEARSEPGGNPHEHREKTPHRKASRSKLMRPSCCEVTALTSVPPTDDD